MDDPVPVVKLEERYIVFKIRDLDEVAKKALYTVKNELWSRGLSSKPRRYLVLESDWPEYAPAVATLEKRIRAERLKREVDTNPLQALRSALFFVNSNCVRGTSYSVTLDRLGDMEITVSRGGRVEKMDLCSSDVEVIINRLLALCQTSI